MKCCCFLEKLKIRVTPFFLGLGLSLGFGFKAHRQLGWSLSRAACSQLYFLTHIQRIKLFKLSVGGAPEKKALAN